MTEAEWLACTDPEKMLGFLGGQPAERKLKLFAVACCQRVSHLLTDRRSREAISVAEQDADGLAGNEELAATVEAAQTAFEMANQRANEVTDEPDDYRVAVPASDAAAAAAALNHHDEVVNCAFSVTDAVSMTVHNAAELMGDPQAMIARASESVIHCNLLRDIFGPLPFRPVTVQPHVLAWNDRLVVRLAQSIYDERRWGDMPLLGDALLDAGCDNEEVLAHCRLGGEHVRGCWVVDLLLGRS